MTRRPTESLPAGADTPVDERPPYGDDGSRWRTAIVAGAVLVAIVAAVVAAFLAARAAWRFVRGRETGEVIIIPGDLDQPYAGPAYRVEFFDGTYPQLTDRRLSLVLPAVHGPAADAALDRLARELRADVESRDSQRCFRPRVELYDGAGRLVRSWDVAA